MSRHVKYEMYGSKLEYEIAVVSVCKSWIFSRRFAEIGT